MEDFDDLIVTVEDLQNQGIVYDTSLTELTFNGKHYKKYLSFRKSLLKAGTDYCKKTLGRKELYFLVLEENTFTIWRSGQPLESAPLNPPDPVDISQPAMPQSSTAPPLVQTIEPQFLDYCQQTMVRYIGSVASQHVQATLAHFPNLTHRQFVDKLAACIPDPQQAEEFWQHVLTGGVASGQQPTPPDSPPSSTARQPPQQPESSPSPQFKRIYRGISY